MQPLEVTELFPGCVLCDRGECKFRVRSKKKGGETTTPE